MIKVLRRYCSGREKSRVEVEHLVVTVDIPNEKSRDLFNSPGSAIPSDKPHRYAGRARDDGEPQDPDPAPKGGLPKHLMQIDEFN